MVVSGVVRQRYAGPEGSSQQLLGVGSIFGELGALCGSRLPGLETVEALGNSFGRGPLVYCFSPAAVDALRKK